MSLRLHNTLSRKIEDFKPLKTNEVSLYTCGPTVYNYPHIGNYRAYIFADILKRYLSYTGYNVKHVMNITDVDDKTIRDAQIQSKTLKEFTQFYTQGFFDDCKSLNIVAPTHQPKATESIDGMVHIIETLLAKDYAYKGADGSIYFNIHKDKEYGKLSHIDLATLRENADGRVVKDEYTKEDARDFALWKAYEKNDDNVYWDTPFGRGRPGWHIECSAMSMDNLGETIDIHTGGVDLIFPHHENEIAQSECATGKTFANYFIHNEHLLVNGAKMSKSAGNFYTLRDLIEKGIHPLSFRMWLYTAHYRTRINFTLEAVQGTQTALKRLYEAYKSLGTTTGGIHQGYKDSFMAFMDNDLDTPQALALVWELLKDQSVSFEDKRATLLDFDKVLGLGLADIEFVHDIPEDVRHLVEMRVHARNEKNWILADEMRDKIAELGYEVTDTESGSKIVKL